MATRCSAGSVIVAVTQSERRMTAGEKGHEVSNFMFYAQSTTEYGYVRLKAMRKRTRKMESPERARDAMKTD